MLLSYSNFFRFCNAAAAAILDFQKFEILTVSRLYPMRHRAKFRQNP